MRDHRALAFAPGTLNLARIWACGLALAVGAMAVPVAAARGGPATPAGLRSWLEAVEAVPDAAALHRAGGSSVARTLDAVARDLTERSYARHRAVSFLGMLRDANATARLRAHLKNSDEDLRSTAALAWLAGPGRRTPAVAEPDLAALLADPSPAVRASAARGLAWFGQRPVAAAWVAKRLAVESDAQVRVALESSRRALLRVP